MTIEKAKQLQDNMKELKDLKAKLMGWEDSNNYTMDGQVEAYLTGVLAREA